MKRMSEKEMDMFAFYVGAGWIEFRQIGDGMVTWEFTKYADDSEINAMREHYGWEAPAQDTQER